jgi:sodium/potassium-transporting ATPase subunit alpha
MTPSLFFYSYFIAGTIIGVGCLVAYLSVFWINDFAVSDLLSSTETYWKVDSPMFKTHDGPAQIRIHEQACGAWQITLIIGQIFNLISCTTRRVSIFKNGLLRNRCLAVSVVIELIILAIVLLVPGISDIVKLQPPPAFVWLIPFVFGVLLLVFNEVRKLFLRRGTNDRLLRMLRW